MSQRVRSGTRSELLARISTVSPSHSLQKNTLISAHQNEKVANRLPPGLSAHLHIPKFMFSLIDSFDVTMMKYSIPAGVVWKTCQAGLSVHPKLSAEM
jgi:hypothetical protein